MLRITLEVDAPPEAAQGIKEKIAMDFERYGDVRVVKIERVGVQGYQQMTMEGE